MTTMKAIYTGKVTVKGGRQGHVASSDGHLDARLAFPAALGGDGEGTNPEQLFGAGYGACFASTIGAIARAEKLAPAALEVAAEVDMLHDGAARFDLAVRLHVRATGIGQAELDALVAKAKEACPYSRATRNTLATVVTTEAA